MGLTDWLPTNMRFVSVTFRAASCAEANGTITCELRNLATGASATLSSVNHTEKGGHHRYHRAGEQSVA
jgi:hypothetical protein